MPFKPGNNANPTGRPKKTKEQVAFEKWCQEKVATEGKRALAKMLFSKDIKVVQWAVGTMLDRGFGRPAEVLVVTSRDESKLGVEELTAEIAALIPDSKNKGSGIDLPSQGTA